MLSSPHRRMLSHRMARDAISKQTGDCIRRSPRRLQRSRAGFKRAGNSYTALDDPLRPHWLMDTQRKNIWSAALAAVARALNPHHDDSFRDNPKGVRFEHQARSHLVKMHDKAAGLLRIENTFARTCNLSRFLPPPDNPEDKLDWSPMRRGVTGEWPERRRSARAADVEVASGGALTGRE
jgi:hypothetical protein